MARVPTWTELRLDAIKLAKLQKECYYDVHQLLDSKIPELDRKLSYLEKINNQKNNIKLKTSLRHKPQEESEQIFARTTQLPATPSLEPQYSQSNPSKRITMSLTTSRSQPILNNVTTKPTTIEHSTADRYPPRKIKKQPTTRDTTTETKKAPSSNKLCTKSQYHKKTETLQDTPKDRGEDRLHDRMQDIEELDHLKPLPLPLCEYLKLNRPELVLRANKRVMYLKKKSQKRKAATKIVNSLKNIRLSPPKININPPISRNYSAPEYKVKYKISENEMKRITAKRYERLPEVKKRRSEEVRNHMKVQNYKNRLEYGRKLLENRRQGIINYPLRAASDDTHSMTSSQDDISLNGYDCNIISNDSLKSDPYY